MTVIVRGVDAQSSSSDGRRADDEPATQPFAERRRAEPPAVPAERRPRLRPGH